MFNHASSNIRKWAKIVNWIGIILLSIVAIGFLVYTINNASGGGSRPADTLTLVIPLLIYLVIGAILCRIISLLIYNIGDIADHADSVHADMDLLLAQNKAQMDDLLAAVRSLEKNKAE